jgi:C4-dicarboxylate transporter DctM subunit
MGLGGGFAAGAILGAVVTNWSEVPQVLLRSANMSAMLLYIITNAVLFSFVLANENIPNALADWLLSLNLGPWGFLLVVNLLLLIAGNFMEPSSIILIMAPILFPTAMKLGIDPVHFGILIDVNMEVGLCHPPVGLNLYVASGIAGLGITELTKAVMPWLITMLVMSNCCWVCWIMSSMSRVRSGSWPVVGSS